MVLLLTVLAGCDATCGPFSGRADDGVCYPLAPLTFPGIVSATWTAGDALDAEWIAATGAIGEVSYALSAETLDGDVVARTDTAGLAASLSGLDDGEYLLRVVATDSVGRSAGDDRVNHQLVGANRLVHCGELALPEARAVDGEGDRVVVASMDGSVLLVDISDVLAPVVLATWTELGEVSDVDLDNGLVYVATDTTLHPDQAAAVRVYDGLDLVATIAPAEDAAHTLEVADGLLFLASTDRQVEAIWDVSDPTSPRRVGEWHVPSGGGVHDQAYMNGRLYVAYTSGWAILDVSDPTAPVAEMTATADWDAPFVHNLAPTGDGDLVAMSEEKPGGSLRVWDPTGPTLVDTFQTYPDHSVHNVAVRDRYVYAAWFVDGVLVFDIDDLTVPLGTYDTWQGDESLQAGADGEIRANVSGAASVWPGGEHVAVADAGRGLVLFDFFPVTIEAR